MSTIYVNSDQNSNGYHSIQEAIDNASAGDTILVAAGSYSETNGTITVDKALTFQGANAGVAGSAARGSESVVNAAVSIQAANVTFNGFDFAGPANAGVTIDATGSTGATITNSVLVDGSDGNNIGLQANSSGLSFTRNLVSNYGDGGYINDPASGDISGNTFENNGTALVLDSAGVAVHGNAISGSGGADIATDVGAGFATTDGDNVDVGSYVYDNTYSTRSYPGDRAISINPQQDGITVTGTDANDRLRDDFGHTGITFIGGAGIDSINASFADLNSDTFADIQSGEYITVDDRSDATAVLNGSQLAITSGGQTSYVTLTGANGSVAVTNDASAGTSTITYTAAPPSTTPPAQPDTVSFSQQVGYSEGIFTLSGKASSAVGVASVEITAQVDGVATNLGYASVNADGTFTFADQIGAHQQGFLKATLTDNAGVKTVSADPLFSLTGGLGPYYGAGRQTLYNQDGSEAAATQFSPAGSKRVSVQGPGQTITSAYDDVFRNGYATDTTFVFEPGHSSSIIDQFRIGGTGHDTLSFQGSDFGQTSAAQLGTLLANTHDSRGGVVIVDPTTQDTVKLVGFSKSQLVQNQRDIVFR